MKKTPNSNIYPLELKSSKIFSYLSFKYINHYKQVEIKDFCNYYRLYIDLHFQNDISLFNVNLLLKNGILRLIQL